MLKLIHTAFNLIFPRTCFSCSKKGAYLCPNCLREIRDPDISYPRGADCLLTSFAYRAPAIKKALRRLKYASASDVAQELAAVVAEDLAPYIKYERRKPMVCWIPLTKKRERRRGFNQAEILAKHLANFLNLDYGSLLMKTGETRPQAEIQNRKERLENIKGAFEVKKDASVPWFAIIVDDISTTGATMNEAARVLKKAGAKKIICAAVARG